MRKTIPGVHSWSRMWLDRSVVCISETEDPSGTPGATPPPPPLTFPKRFEMIWFLSCSYGVATIITLIKGRVTDPSPTKNHQPFYFWQQLGQQEMVGLGPFCLMAFGWLQLSKAADLIKVEKFATESRKRWPKKKSGLLVAKGKTNLLPAREFLRNMLFSTIYHLK